LTAEVIPPRVKKQLKNRAVVGLSGVGGRSPQRGEWRFGGGGTLVGRMAGWNSIAAPSRHMVNWNGGSGGCPPFTSPFGEPLENFPVSPPTKNKSFAVNHARPKPEQGGTTDARSSAM